MCNNSLFELKWLLMTFLRTNFPQRLGRPRTARTASSCDSKSHNEISAVSNRFSVFVFSSLHYKLSRHAYHYCCRLGGLGLRRLGLPSCWRVYRCILGTSRRHTKKGNFTRETIHESRALRLADLGRRRIETMFGLLSGSLRWLTREKSLTLGFDATVHVPSRSVLQGQWLEWRIEQRYVHLWVLIITSPRNCICSLNTRKLTCRVYIFFLASYVFESHH